MARSGIGHTTPQFGSNTAAQSSGTDTGAHWLGRWLATVKGLLSDAIQVVMHFSSTPGQVTPSGCVSPAMEMLASEIQVLSQNLTFWRYKDWKRPRNSWRSVLADPVQIQGGATYPGGNILLGGGSGTDDIRFRTTGASSHKHRRRECVITGAGRLNGRRN